MPTTASPEPDQGDARSSTARKLWAIGCVIGFTAFGTFGFIALGGVFGERDVGAMTYILGALGLGLGVVGWFKVMAHAPRMHGRRASARARMEEEFRRDLDQDAG